MDYSKEVHPLDRRQLLLWATPINDPKFLEDYAEERKFWEADGRMKGGMDNFILYGLAKKHRKVEAKPEPEKKAKKEPALA